MRFKIAALVAEGYVEGENPIARPFRWSRGDMGDLGETMAGEKEGGSRLERCLGGKTHRTWPWMGCTAQREMC